MKFLGDSFLVGALTILYRGCSLGTKVMVADFASIRENVEVGEYTIVGRGVTVENKVKIGKRCKLETEFILRRFPRSRMAASSPPKSHSPTIISWAVQRNASNFTRGSR